MGGQSALALAPGPIDPQNVKMGKGKFRLISTFFDFFGRISIFWSFFARFWRGPKVISEFAENQLTAIAHFYAPPVHKNCAILVKKVTMVLVKLFTM